MAKSRAMVRFFISRHSLQLFDAWRRTMGSKRAGRTTPSTSATLSSIPLELSYGSKRRNSANKRIVADSTTNAERRLTSEVVE